MQSVLNEVDGQSIVSLTEDNDAYRRIVYSGDHMQITLNTLRHGDAIPFEIHEDTDQYIECVSGLIAVATAHESPPPLSRSKTVLGDGDVYVVPAGTPHKIANWSPGTEEAKFYTIYGGRPLHPVPCETKIGDAGNPPPTGSLGML